MICSPIFILLIINCISCLGQSDINTSSLIQTFPYIGIYLHALGGRSSTALVSSFLKMIVLIYFVYLSALYIGTFFLFYKQLPKGVDENFLAYLAILELISLIFIRTRSSLKWFPLFSMALIYTFLFYVQNTLYGYYALFLYSIICFLVVVFAFILLEFEIPAASWNDSFHYTPSLNRPRCLYFPLFNLSWYYDLPQLWTMFYPLYGREHFTQNQLSLVDRNYMLLSQVLEEAQNNPDNNLDMRFDFQNNLQQQQLQQQQGGQNNIQQNENNNIEENNDQQEVRIPVNYNNNQEMELQQQINILDNNQNDFDKLQDDNSREQNLLENEQGVCQNTIFSKAKGILIGGGVNDNIDSQKNNNDDKKYQKFE
ncbi:hypothetical protein IMG5_139650 [Ichthyophthirius multifiliis]|uniref:Transmembrane protein n=1 Tax=Ichthyophthirius multifiliis TaxID=5932 RepID=G0QX90_ICHMU|nr:hypothetical protein IMG5_139650 [Ichthyophthirius multifiliis]EGR30162.1 hypothetical protein IMG5_139650 [Ichthyophthirius multifiliis]|eukprot:XP_004031398.1 hypothetical protein IMG5_139650 [Ichthyophthirius multifiliis]